MTSEEFKNEFISEKTNKHHHHKEGFCTQKTFRKQALSLVDTISEMGTPFLNDSLSF